MPSLRSGGAAWCPRIRFPGLPDRTTNDHPRVAYRPSRVRMERDVCQVNRFRALDVGNCKQDRGRLDGQNHSVSGLVTHVRQGCKK